MNKTRILFVDDEPGIRMTLPSILEMHGYEITVAASVPEALELIQRHKFDVLISDLNIDAPADGLVVVATMRRFQPAAVRFVLTGYPDFHTALEAIRQQVDSYLVKPAQIETLLSEIKEKLQRRHPHQPQQVSRAAELLKIKQEELLNRWLREWKLDPQLARFHLSQTETLGHVPGILENLLSQPPQIAPAGERTVRSAVFHGVTRRKQGFSAALLVREMRLFRKVIFQVIHEELLNVNLSFLMVDMTELSQNIDALLEESIAAFLDSSQKPHAA